MCFAGMLADMLVPQQQRRHAFALQFLVQPNEIGPNKCAGSQRDARQAAVQGRLVKHLNRAPVQLCCTGQGDVFGNDVFGDVQGCGNALMRQMGFELETQDVLDFAHSDHWGIGSGSSKKLARLPLSVEKKYAQHHTLRSMPFWRHDRRFRPCDQSFRSRQKFVTINRNTHSAIWRNPIHR